MIVKDVDIDESGIKTYVFGMDERYEDLMFALKLMVDTAENGGWPSSTVVIAKAAIAKYEGKDEPLDSN